MIDFTEQIRENRRALIYDVFRRIEVWLEPFADDLQEFLSTLLKARLPADWRERWHAFIDESAAKGFVVKPQSVIELEAWIEAWARRRRLLPIQAVAPQVEHLPPPNRETAPSGESDLRNDSDDAKRGETIEKQPKDRGAPGQTPEQRARPTQTQIREQFFNDELAEAQRCLDEIKRVLDALGDKLDAAKADEKTEVETEADAVEELIFRYNDALESARDAWLRDNLSGDANARLLSLLTPRSFGLPAFVDDGQAVRAQKQERAISQRLAERNVTMNRIVFAAQTVEWAGTAAGIALGGGVVLKAAQSGGKWAVVKAVAVSAAAMAGEQVVEGGLRAIGASEETIHGFRLAAVVVTFLILHRKNASASSEPPTSTAPAGSSAPPASPPPQPAGELPAPSNPSAIGRPAPKGPLKNPSGDLDDAARAARTQPHGPPARAPAGTSPAKPSTLPPANGTGLVPTAPVELGEWGEILLRNVLGGLGFKPKAAYPTSLGNRFVDWMLNGVAHEAKAGLNVKLTSKIREQALKDAELIATNEIKGAHWHFFRGASKELLEFLNSLGIEYTVH